MNIKSDNNHNCSFKAGLNNIIKAEEKFTNPGKIEQLFLDKYGIEASFLNNNSAAYANQLCLKILFDLNKKLNLNFSFPFNISVFKRKNLINSKMPDNFCIPDTMSILQNDYPFPGRSIFFKDFKNLEEIDEKAESLNKKRISSSNHFLSPFIHEWMHNIHLDWIYTKLGYGGNCSFLNQIYPKKNTKITGVEFIKNLEQKTLTPRENNVVFETLGEYSTKPYNQYMEVFSESYTKFICESLNGYNIIKNPLDIIKNTSKEFQKIFEKICNI